MIEYLALFISRHAAFFEAHGNWVLITLTALIYISLYYTIKNSWKKGYLKWGLFSILFAISFILGSLLFMINFPLKPMVTSLASIQRNIGDHLEDFTFTTLNDKENHSLADYQGKVVVLNFWATYCGPCLEEFPDLRKLEETYSGKVEVIALSDEDPDKISRVTQKLNTPSNLGFYSNEKWMNLESFRPVTVILDRDGIVREYKFGRNRVEEFSKMVERYL